MHRFVHVAFCLLSLAGALACGSHGGSARDAGGMDASSDREGTDDALADVSALDAELDVSPDAAELPACASEVGVTSASAVEDALATSGWPSFLGPGAMRPITTDFRADAEIVLRSSEIPVPTECTVGMEDCFSEVRFTSWVDSGVTLEDEAGDDLTFQARAVRISAGTRFRVRAFYYPEYPFVVALVPVVVIVAACSVACAQDELRCADDLTCYGLGTRYCRDCEQRDRAECACVGPDGPLAAGADCTYALSMDYMFVGTCQSGQCFDAD